MRNGTSTLVLAVAATLGCHGGAEPGAKPEARAPIRAAVVPAASIAWPSGLEVTGTIEAARRALPGTSLLGRVVTVLHDAGDAVGAGAVLARIESAEVDARLAQAEAAVAAARAGETNAQGTRERLERLLAKEAATESAVDAAVAAHEAARAQRAAAEQAVAAARTWVAHADVRAPFAGVVTERRVEAGDTAMPGTPLFVVEDTARVKVEAQVAESHALGLARGDVVEVDVPALGTSALRGSIDEVLPAANPGSRTFTVRVLLDNPARRLRSGLFARVRLPGAEESVTTVPETAVVRRGPLAGVFVVSSDGKARIRWVTLGARRDGACAVESGLAAGESVVVDPPADLLDGSPVEAR